MEGALVRGSRERREIALVFTGHSYAEGAVEILDTLASRKMQGSFFLTGDFLRNHDFRPLVLRMKHEGHYVGPHSDRHLLCCSQDAFRRTLISHSVFRRDLLDNVAELERLGIARSSIRYWLPAFESHNRQIAEWSRNLGLTLINYTAGTLSHADYTEERSAHFVSSARILQSIHARERNGGLNGFILLFHTGAGPGRRDKMHRHLGRLIDELSAKGYRFVRVDAIRGNFKTKSEAERPGGDDDNSPIAVASTSYRYLLFVRSQAQSDTRQRSAAQQRGPAPGC